MLHYRDRALTYPSCRPDRERNQGGRPGRITGQLADRPVILQFVGTGNSRPDFPSLPPFDGYVDGAVPNMILLFNPRWVRLHRNFSFQFSGVWVSEN